VLNVNTGVDKAFTTNRDGIYDTVSTPNGQYTVTITVPGFRQLVLGPITLDVGTITLNGKLAVGSDQQQVMVSADTAALISTESGEQSTIFDEKTMLELPQVGQDWSNFTILLPGSAGRIFGQRGRKPWTLGLAQRRYAIQRQHPVGWRDGDKRP
jgi:hypothetical protein